MKKTILSVLMTFGIFSMVSADIGVKIGVSGQIGSMETSGKEVSTDGTTESSTTEEALFGTAGFFIEKDLKFIPVPIINRISLGYDNIIHDLDLGTQTNTQSGDGLAADGSISGTSRDSANHSLNAKIDGFETVYATLNITDWLYVKGGNVSVDVKTEFKGTSTSSYATSHSLDGTVFGFGLHHENDNGLFMRLEYNDYNIDGKSVKNNGTDSKFTATLNDVSGTTGRISIGKAF
jgi:hypothetical protein